MGGATGTTTSSVTGMMGRGGSTHQSGTETKSHLLFCTAYMTHLSFDNDTQTEYSFIFFMTLDFILTPCLYYYSMHLHALISSFIIQHIYFPMKMISPCTVCDHTAQSPPLPGAGNQLIRRVDTLHEGR